MTNWIHSVLFLRLRLITLCFLISPLVGCDAGAPDAVETTAYASNWNNTVDGYFAGAETWTNPLQDWRVKNGKLECFVGGEERNTYLLTREIAGGNGEFEMSVGITNVDFSEGRTDEGYVGFRIGVKGRYLDYRDAAVRGRGLKTGVTVDGELFIGNTSGDRINVGNMNAVLRLKVAASNGKATLSLQAIDKAGAIVGEVKRAELDAGLIRGGIGLSCHSGELTSREGLQERRTESRHGNLSASFSDLRLSGSLVTAHDDRAYGPIAFTLYTLDEGTMKMTVQMMPVSARAGDEVILETRTDGVWSPVQTSRIVADSRTAHFRIENWDATKARKFRVAFSMKGRDGSTSDHYYMGTISKEPEIGGQLKAVSLSCQLDKG